MFRVRSRKFPEKWGTLLGIVPFVLILGIYAIFSHQRLSENPKDKLLPGFSGLAKGWSEVTRLRPAKVVDYTVQSGDTLESIAKKVSGSAEFAEEIRIAGGGTISNESLEAGTVVRVPETERYLLKDVGWSLGRLTIGVAVAVVLSLSIGLSMGVFPPVERFFYPLVSALSKIPPLAVLPIIFIFMGATNEAPRITIIALGITPVIIMDTLLRCKEVASELITKAYTLGASTVEVVFKVVLPQVWPGFLNSVRIALGPAWVYLIAAEAISSDVGLGYRIFVVQRQLGMNIILIYVVLIMLLGLAIDWGMRWWIENRYRWAQAK